MLQSQKHQALLMPLREEMVIGPVGFQGLTKAIMVDWGSILEKPQTNLNFGLEWLFPEQGKPQNRSYPNFGTEQLFCKHSEPKDDSYLKLGTGKLYPKQSKTLKNHFGLGWLFH